MNDHGANAPESETRSATKGEKAARRDGRDHTMKQNEPEGLKAVLHSAETSRLSKDSPDALARHAPTTTIRRRSRKRHDVTDVNTQ